MSEFDFINDLKIAPYSLDKEWLEHPGRVETINREWADAVLERNKAEEKMKVTFAEIDLRIRKECPPDLINPKEAAYKNYVLTHPEYRKAVKDYLDAEHQVNVLQAGCKAFSSRGDALKAMTQLLLSDRYSEPSSPIDRKMFGKGVDKGSEATAEGLESSSRIGGKRSLVRKS